MNIYLKETKILDYFRESIQKLINDRRWNQLDTISRIKHIYDFVRDEIKFGYNTSDDIPASAILKDGYGLRNTTATFLVYFPHCGLIQSTARI